LVITVFLLDVQHKES